MLDRGGDSRFAHEPGPEFGIGRQVEREDLERDRPLERQVRRPEHDAHATSADESVQAVATEDRTKPQHVSGSARSAAIAGS